MVIQCIFLYTIQYVLFSLRDDTYKMISNVYCLIIITMVLITNIIIQCNFKKNIYPILKINIYFISFISFTNQIQT